MGVKGEGLRWGWRGGKRLLPNMLLQRLWDPLGEGYDQMNIQKVCLCLLRRGESEPMTPAGPQLPWQSLMEDTGVVRGVGWGAKEWRADQNFLI